MSMSMSTSMKAVSVSRLGLSTAAISVRHDKMLKRETEMPFNTQSVLWMDSMSVLRLNRRYVNNESKRFHTIQLQTSRATLKEQ